MSRGRHTAEGRAQKPAAQSSCLYSIINIGLAHELARGCGHVPRVAAHDREDLAKLPMELCSGLRGVPYVVSGRVQPMCGQLQFLQCEYVNVNTYSSEYVLFKANFGIRANTHVFTMEWIPTSLHSAPDADNQYALLSRWHSR